MANTDIKVRNVSQANVRASEGAGTTTLTKDDSRVQLFNLSAARDCVLPSTGVKKGHTFHLYNPNAFALTVKASDTSTISAGGSSFTALQDTPTTNSHWKAVGLATASAAGIVRGGTVPGKIDGVSVAAGYIGSQPL